MSNYKAANTAFSNLLMKYSDSPISDQISFMSLKSSYLYAVNSIDKKKERLFHLTLFSITFPGLPRGAWCEQEGEPCRWELRLSPWARFHQPPHPPPAEQTWASRRPWAATWPTIWNQRKLWITHRGMTQNTKPNWLIFENSRQKKKYLLKGRSDDCLGCTLRRAFYVKELK